MSFAGPSHVDPAHQGPRPLPELPPNLRHAADRLVSEFDGQVPAADVERCLADEYAALMATARVHHFVGIFAERHARERLRQVAPTTRRDD